MPAMPAKHLGNDAESWIEYRRLVLSELERLSLVVERLEAQLVAAQLASSHAIAETHRNMLERIHHLIDELDEKISKRTAEADDRVNKLSQEVVTLKAQSALLGAAAGFIVAVVAVVVAFFVRN